MAYKYRGKIYKEIANDIEQYVKKHPPRKTARSLNALDALGSLDADLISLKTTMEGLEKYAAYINVTLESLDYTADIPADSGYFTITGTVT